MANKDKEPLEFTTTDAESEEDVSQGLAQQVAKAVLWSTDWTVETIYRQLEKGNIELNPEFQRREAWNDKKKSLFIESLFLGLPIPQIVLAERKDKPGSYIVIDGKQRLLTIRRFCAKKDDENFKPFCLEGLSIRSEFNDLSYEQIAADPKLSNDVRFFENQTFRTTIIRNWPSENFLYTVFLRLNTGSVPLSPQELRQALHPGPFLTFADKFTQQSKIIPALLRKDKPDFRMRDVELFVRFFAFRFYLNKYNGNLKQFLDETCLELNTQWLKEQAQCEAAASELEHAIDLTFRVFGEDEAFRKWTVDGFEGRFNRAIFDIMVYYFADLKTAPVVAASKKIKAAFQKLCSSDNDFLKSIESTTKSIDATTTRLEKWGTQLQKLVGQKLTVPRLVKGKIVTK
ncbi:MAG: DUF262 domain-containing protein [Limisphaerales bacterium]